MRIRNCAQLYLLVLISSFLEPAFCENLPETGTFEGVYHRDRWGVGAFEFFIVPPALQEKFAAFDGRRIRVTVTRGIQAINPGPVEMQEIASIVALPDPAIAPRIELRPVSPKSNEPFQVICWLQNGTDKPCLVRTRDVHVDVRCREKNTWPTKPSYFSASNGDDKLTTFVWGSSMEYLLVGVPFEYGKLATGNELLISEHTSFPLVAHFDKGLPKAGYEIKLTARGIGESSGEAFPSAITWLNLDIDKESDPHPEPKAPLRVLNTSITPQDDGYELRLTVAAAEERSQLISLPAPNGKRSWAGRLLAFSRDGGKIPLRTSEDTHHEDPWRLHQIGPEGHEIKFSFRQESRFTGRAIQRLRLDLLTNLGVDSEEIAGDFSDVQAVENLPEFGKSVQGAKLRVRPAKTRFQVGKPIEFYVQAVNEGGSPIIWWLSSRTTPPSLSENLIIEVDGEPIDAKRRKAEYVYGWAATWTCGTPQEWTFTMPKSVTVSPGKHTFRYSVASKGGVFKNSIQQDVPVLSGTIASNVAEFEVQD